MAFFYLVSFSVVKANVYFALCSQCQCVVLCMIIARAFSPSLYWTCTFLKKIRTSITAGPHWDLDYIWKTKCLWKRLWEYFTPSFWSQVLRDALAFVYYLTTKCLGLFLICLHFNLFFIVWIGTRFFPVAEHGRAVCLVAATPPAFHLAAASIVTSQDVHSTPKLPHFDPWLFPCRRPHGGVWSGPSRDIAIIPVQRLWTPLGAARAPPAVVGRVLCTDAGRIPDGALCDRFKHRAVIFVQLTRFVAFAPVVIGGKAIVGIVNHTQDLTHQRGA